MHEAYPSANILFRIRNVVVSCAMSSSRSNLQKSWAKTPTQRKSLTSACLSPHSFSFLLCCYLLSWISSGPLEQPKISSFHLTGNSNSCHIYA